MRTSPHPLQHPLQHPRRLPHARRWPAAARRAGASVGQARGFTLMEMLIAVAVLAILAAVAYPSLMESVRKGRRSEAFAALAAMQQAQERWRSTHSGYALTLADLGITNANTSSGYYVMQAPTTPAGATQATGYIVTVDGSGSSQAQDGQCARLSMQVISGDIQYGGCKSCSTFTYSASNPCWSR